MDVKTNGAANVKTARKRDVSINLRATREEKEEIERCAATLGMTQTELVMSGVQVISGMIKKHKENQKAGKAERGEHGEGITDSIQHGDGAGSHGGKEDCHKEGGKETTVHAARQEGTVRNK